MNWSVLHQIISLIVALNNIVFQQVFEIFAYRNPSITFFTKYSIQGDPPLSKSLCLGLAANQAGLVKALFECMPVFPLTQACIVIDLTPIVTIDRCVRLPLSKWRGHRVDFCSWLMRVVVFQIKTYRTLAS